MNRTKKNCFPHDIHFISLAAGNLEVCKYLYMQMRINEREREREKQSKILKSH